MYASYKKMNYSGNYYDGSCSLIPPVYIMPHIIINPAEGVFMAEPVADIIAVTFTGILFFVQFRKALRNMQV